MEEEKLIEEHKVNLEESIEFFSDKNKKQRELWVVREFLTSLSMPFQEDELKFVSDEPPDILFRGANFEVKELLDEGRRRHDEYKESLFKSQSAKKFSDLLELYTPREILIQEVVNLINAKLLNIMYSLGVCKNLDILFYVNLQRSVISNNDYIIPDEEKWRKWRSICIVEDNKLGSVLWASEQAPDFLKSVKGKIIIRGEK